MRIDYQGAFLIEKLQGSLSKTIGHQHVTFITPRQQADLPSEILGKEVELTIDGYANDGQNEGFRVRMPEELKTYYINEAIPHITVSIAYGAKAVNTGKLLFEDLVHPFVVTARMGLFVEGKPVFEK